VIAPPSGYLAVARVLSPHGVRGEVRCQLLTDFPERFARTPDLFAESGQRHLSVERSRLQRDSVILKFAGFETRSDAQALVGQVLLVPDSEAVRLPADTYFWHQIVGLKVQTVAGEDLGTVAEILRTGANDVYVVRGAKPREVLIPAVADVVREIDLERGVIVIEPMEGLLS
jgi:16S rRNA processing protein RimM